MPVTSEELVDPTHVTVVTLDRPERRNALDITTLRALRAAVVAAADAGARVILVTGAGTNFCAGADLSTVEDGEFVGELRGTLEDLRTVPVPVIAAIHGPALGAGTQLAMACDLRVATPDATFGIPAAKLGLTVDFYTVHQLGLAAGHSVARAMLTGAEVFDARRLVEVGFVHRLAPEGADIRAAGIEWAADLARLAPLTIAAHKAMLADAETTAEASPRAVAVREAAWTSDDLAEGLAAFRDHRSPEFRGN